MRWKKHSYKSCFSCSSLMFLDRDTKAMQKRPRTPVTQDDISEYLFSQDDFALELFVSGEAAKLNLPISHGGTYEDPVTRKHRQFDLRITRVSRNRELNLAIECKALRTTFPLLVSRIPRTKAESKHCLIYTRNYPESIPGYVPGYCINVSPSSALYESERLVGKSFTQVGRNGEGELTSSDTETFDKWSQALSSLADLVADAWRGYQRSTSRGFVAAAVPVLVVSDNTLWVADYSADGSLSCAPRQESHVEFYVGREYAPTGGHKFVASHLHVLTRSAVAKFFSEVACDETWWNSVFPPEHVPATVGA